MNAHNDDLLYSVRAAYEYLIEQYGNDFTAVHGNWQTFRAMAHNGDLPMFYQSAPHKRRVYHKDTLRTWFESGFQNETVTAGNLSKLSNS